ncbi:MAG: potassium-transporting ATPase subunit KdpA [Phycisphaerae bacterium]|nr:potassium-transporting ATPase subunit KdpA [Phycisphaerae bacterium]
MTIPGLIQLVGFVVTIAVCARLLGPLVARILDGEPGRAPLGLGLVLGPLERGVYRIAGVTARAMTWREYALGILAFNALGVAAVYGLQRLQHHLPANPAALGPVEPASAFNTAISFATNTNWQGYAGETTMSYLTQMLGLGAQNFLSAATGIAVFAALARGLRRSSESGVGNCWVDLTRSTLYVLLPLSTLLALVLVGQGVVQTFRAPIEVEPLVQTSQTLPLGPAASQIAIKQLGTNGGGFFNANGAHPFENPTALANALQCLAILLLPAALCHTFGSMVRDRRQGWALLAAMLAIFIPCLAVTVMSEHAANPALASLGVDQALGNVEGKELRFGVDASALWASATTAASNGSVNSMHDSMMPLGGFAAMWLMQLGEVVFGGVGSGLYGMLMFAIVAVFVAGLMVGRAPEYLGKKIEPFEMRMACIVILLPCAVVLVGTAIACVVPAGTSSVSNPGPHGFSQILYAFSSAGNNNGSAFAGLAANTPFYNVALGIAMFLARYWLIVPVLAVAGAMSRKSAAAATEGTLPTHTPTFVLMLVAVVVIVGALTFVPSLALGPVAEHVQLFARR